MREEAVLQPAALLRPIRAYRNTIAFLRRNATHKAGAAVVMWRVEARLATPVALLLVATIGRWNGALAMGGIMACYSALFIFLLDGERVIDEIRNWLHERRWAQRRVLPIIERQDKTGAVYRVLAIPATIMLLGPFWRALTYHLARMPRALAYALSMGGSFPHSLFWTGIVLGSVWELLLLPLAQRTWDLVQPLAERIF
jgi:hypothetical protein